MRCMPPCASCRLAGACSREGEPFKIPKASVSRNINASPNDRKLLYMPCGCLGLPVELVRQLGDNFESFMCDVHGPVKVTKKWKKEVKTCIGKLVKVPSEYGYTVAVQEEL
jgi:hypothetical protein